MTREEIEEFKQILLEKRNELLKDLDQFKDRDAAATLKDSSGENSAYSFHMADVGTDNMEREKAFFLASREGKYLSHIEQALERIDDGSYGICPDCSQPIPRERLLAVPTATRCVPCKEKAEKQ
ncbi:MAG: TraR/DksA family transcriptional regulator [bacterium]